MPRVLADHRRIDLRLVDELGDPLPHGGDAGGEHERGGLQEIHAQHSDDGLARAAGQDDHPRASALGPAGVEHGRRLGLIIAKPEGRVRHLAKIAQRQGQPRPLHIAGEVLDGIADLQQNLFDATAVARLDRKTRGAHSLVEQRSHEFVPPQLGHQGLVVRDEQQPVLLANEPDAAIAGNRLGNIDPHVFGQRVLGQACEVVKDFLRRETGGRGVPKRERRKTIGVDVFRGFIELCETGQGVARVLDTRCSRPPGE